MEIRLRQFVGSQTCFSCDVCCRFKDSASNWSPILTDTDIARLSDNSAAEDILCQEKKFRLRTYKDLVICPFFNPKDNSCKIYSLRPFDCQLYPFLLVKKDKRIFLGYDLKCPFVKEKSASKEFKEYVQYLLEFLKNKDTGAMIRNNPQLAMDYKEDVIFLEELDFL